MVLRAKIFGFFAKKWSIIWENCEKAERQDTEDLSIDYLRLTIDHFFAFFVGFVVRASITV